MKNLCFKIIACAGAASVLLAGCSQENVYDPNAVTKKYEHAWEKNFGKIDPNQTWSTATRATANIDLSDITSEECQVRIYTANPIGTGSCLLAEKQIKGNGSIDFDVPQALDYVFIIAENGQGAVINGYYAINGRTLTIGKAKTRATGNCSTTIGKPIISEGTYWDTSYTNPENPYDHNRPFRMEYYVLQDLTTRESAGWIKEDFLPIVGPNGVFEERKENWNKHSNIKPGVSYKMKSEGPITLTYCFGATNDDDMFGYYYFRDGERSQAKLYVLMESALPHNYLKQNGTSVENMGLSNIQWMQDGTLITGTEFSLAYFDENGNASYNFPEGMNIEFFLVNKKDKSGPADYYHSTFFSTETAQSELGKDIEMVSTPAVTYNYGNTTFLGFEDEMQWGDKDMNDILFTVTGNFEKPDNLGPEITDPESQSWLLACEDLGNTDDFDFNDIVFSVSHVAGTTEATVTPLAAGGTLEAHIYYGDQDLGEIHQLLGQSSYTITNTQSSKGKAGEAIKIAVPTDFSMSQEMGGFQVRIKRNEKEMITINAPQNGTAPQMICIDNSTDWAWPIERTNISEAYPDFGEWGANYNTNSEWYKKSIAGKVVN